MAKVQIDPSWEKILFDEFDKEYFEKLIQFVKIEYSNKTVFPPGNLIFNAFNKTPWEKVKVVIIGQDPYHGPNQAMGLSFSVPEGIRLPPSLQNIYKEIKDDIGSDSITKGDLSKWSEQGVFLLNSVLTVISGNAASHAGKGWEIFTDAVVQKLSDQKEKLVFILWGAYAHKKGQRIDASKHLIIRSAHPSPLSAYNGFFGSKPFSQTNRFLLDNNILPISW